MDLFNVLKDQLSDQVLDQIGNQIRADKKTTEAASLSVLQTMVAAMSRNAGSSKGLSNLAGALDKDHDGSILDDVMGLIEGRSAHSQSKAANGMGIVEHVLGRNTDNVVQMVSKSSGLDLLKTGQLLKLLAPVVMGSLGKVKKQQQLDSGGLSDLLTGVVRQQSSQGQGMDIISKVLDADGDGSVMDEIAGFGLKALGGFLKRRR
jgi:hypothetical protein